MYCVDWFRLQFVLLDDLLPELPELPAGEGSQKKKKEITDEEENSFRPHPSTRRVLTRCLWRQ
jgi:hypothetical protein